MFSDNRSLAGNNPMYDDLVRSMEGYEKRYTGSYKLCTGSFIDSVDIPEIRRIADSDLSNPADYIRLHDLMNMKPFGDRDGVMLYMTNMEAVERHKCLMYHDVFTKRQWDNAFLVTDVFQFNAFLMKLLDSIHMEAKLYIDCYGRLIEHELVSGNLSYDVLSGMDTGKWDAHMDSVKTGNREVYDNPKLQFYCETIKYIGGEIIGFTNVWKRSMPTVVKEVLNFIRYVSSDIDNPHYKGSYVFGL